MTITRAISDENRVRILMALMEHPLCVCMITDLLDLSTSTTSKHLSILRQAHLIKRIKKGRWVYYQRTTIEETSPPIQEILQWLYHHLANNALIQLDQKSLMYIRQKHLTEYPEMEHQMKLCHSKNKAIV